MIERVGVRALQQHASRVLRVAAEGHIVEVTDRGRLVARLVPAASNPVEVLVQAGQGRRATRRPRDLPEPLAATSSTGSLSSLLTQARVDER